MQSLISFIILTLSVDGVRNENSSEIQIGNGKEWKGDPMSDAPRETAPELKALWTHNPITRVALPHEGVYWSRPVHFREPHSLSKLSKTLQRGFDPFFKKADFEFESRRKPITLVSIRKNGFDQRRVLYKMSPDSKSEEIAAELQSPFNEISTFWQELNNA